MTDRSPYSLLFPAAFALALAIGGGMWLAAGTPRAQSNVMYASALAFSALVLWRASSQATAALPHWPAPAWTVILPVGAALLAWGGTLSHHFVADEFVHLYTGRQPFGDLLVEMLVEGETGTFLRPAAFLTFWADRRVWADWMPGYHLTNLALHAAAASGVFFLCRSASALRRLALPASLIFAALPAHAEAVGWVGARFDLVSGLLVVWSTACYLRFRERGHRPLYAAALVLACASFFAKENAYVIPALLIAGELFLTPDRRLRAILPFALLLAGVLVYRIGVLGSAAGYVDALGEPEVFDIGFKTFEGLFVRAPSVSLLGFNWLQPGPAVVAAPIAAGLFLALALAARAGRRVTGFAFAWLLVAAVPAHPLLLVGPSLTNSRILYLGAVGAATAVAALLVSIEPAKLRSAFTIVLLSSLILGSWHNTAALKYTSELSRQFLDDVREALPAPPEGARLVFHGVPESIRGVYFFRVSMIEPVWFAFGREDLRAWRAETLPDAPPGAIHFDWTGDSGGLVERR